MANSAITFPVSSPSAGLTMEGIAGETIAVRDALRIELAGAQGTAGRLYLTDSTKPARSAKSWFAGFAAAAATAGNSITFSDGVISGFSGLTPGATYYASSTPGGITATAPSNALIVGVALNSTTLLSRKGLPPMLVADLGDPLPTLAGGPVFLFEANRETGYDDEDFITVLTDQSGNGNHATIVGSGAQWKAGILNGEPVFRLGGAAHFTLGDISAQFPTAATLFVVVNHTSAPGQYELYNTGVAGNIWRYGDGSGYNGAFRTVRVDNYPSSMPNTGAHSHCIVSSSSTYRMYTDGVAHTAQTASYSAGNEHRIGHYLSGGEDFNGDIALVAAWDTALSAPDIATVHAYINGIYGV